MSKRRFFTAKTVVEYLSHIYGYYELIRGKPRKIPTRLPGTTCGVTVFFNPAGYTQLRRNYDIFRKKLQQQGLPIITVELALDGREYALGKEDAEKLVQLRGGDVMWQKERLLNIGLRHLPEDCDKVVLLDCDILFEDDGWIAETNTLLEQYVLVQPFSHLVHLSKGQPICDWRQCKKGFGEGKIIHGFGYGISKYGKKVLSAQYEHQLGVPGGALAGRRSVLEKHGVYDAGVTGSGDTLTIHAAFLKTGFIRWKSMTKQHQKHFFAWAKKFFKDVRKSVYYRNGVVFHLWHGSQDKRQFGDRHKILQEINFNPESDISIDPNGAWCWTHNKKYMCEQCRQYFVQREEDG